LVHTSRADRISKPEEGLRLPHGIPHTRTAPPNRSRRKAACTLASPISSQKVRSIPRSGGVHSGFYPSFSAQQPGNFSRNSLGTAAQAEVQPSLSHRRIALDPVGA
jgi:hypothetical protein